MNAPNKPLYGGALVACTRCNVSQRPEALTEGKCLDLDRCVRWQVQAALQKAQGGR